MYIDVGTYISWSNESSVPFSSGTVSDLCGYVPGEHNSMGGYINVTNGDGTIWSINTFNINDMNNFNGGGTVIADVNIDQYAIGNAVSQGIVNSGMLNHYVPDNAPQLNLIADTLQQLLDKDKPKEKIPVVIPEVDNKYLIL